MPENKQSKPVSACIGTFSSRVLKVCLILSGISVFTAIIMGSSTVSVWQEITNNQSFIKVAKEMRPNFEESLSLYTGNTQKIIDYLLALRPATEEEFITFISRIEDLGQELSLNLNIKSMDSPNESSIAYQVSFYGSIRDMKLFIRKLDDMPYYIEVSEIKYLNPAFVEESDEEKSSNTPNISLVIKLFIKNQNAT